MRIIVLGATGMAGTAVVNEALSRGHEVTAVSRRRRHRAGAGVTSCLLDVTDVGSVAGLLKDSDAAGVALRPPAGHEGDLVRLTEAVLDAASRSRTTTLLRDAHGESRISPEDLALAVVDELEHPGGEQHVTVIASPRGDSDPGRQEHVMDPEGT